MRCCVGLLFALVFAGCNSRPPQELSILNGMSREAFLKIVSELSGKDITSGMALASNGRELKEIYWELKEYKLFISTDLTDGTLKGITYWRYEDFIRSKSDRALKERPATTIRLDTEKKRFKAE